MFVEFGLVVAVFDAKFEDVAGSFRIGKPGAGVELSSMSRMGIPSLPERRPPSMLKTFMAKRNCAAGG